MSDHRLALFDKTTKKMIPRQEDRCEIDIPGPFGLVICGDSGDLTKRKLIPSLYHLYQDNIIQKNFFILGVSRTEMSTDRFRGLMYRAVKEAFPKEVGRSSWEEFASKLYYAAFDYALVGIGTFAPGGKTRLFREEAPDRTKSHF